MISNRQKDVIDCLEMIESLKNAVDKAHGVGSFFTRIAVLKDISALDLITILAPNKVRFIYKDE